MAQLNIDCKSIRELTFRDRSLRTHSEAQIKQLMHSIEHFGVTNPVLIDVVGILPACHVPGRHMALWKSPPDLWQFNQSRNLCHADG